ncbi:NrdH-redoxin [bacterium]|nr:NrdH-redoxin [bacterium]
MEWKVSQIEIKQKKVVLFTTPTCSWCRRTKQYFREQKVRFKEVDVSRDRAAANDIRRMTGQMGVPVILIGNKPIVGFDKPQIDRLLGL